MKIGVIICEVRRFQVSFFG